MSQFSSKLERDSYLSETSSTTFRNMTSMSSRLFSSSIVS